MTNAKNSHPEFELETTRLQETLDCIKATIQTTRQAHLDGGDDWASFNLEQQKESRLERLAAVLDSPYIGRIDFQEDEHPEVEEFYIGYLNLDGPIRIIDWRAPLASLFYTKNRAQVSYNAPDGTIYGELFLKRHLEIAFSRLVNVMDELDRRPVLRGIELAEDDRRDTLIDPDEYLRLVLEGKKGRELRDVVATIQERQNELIRAKPNQILIVQGAAGSGKTTIALHRVAFLLYPHSAESHFETKKMLIIGASEVFLEFISQVLPHLGIKDVPQLTYTEWVSRLMGRQAPKTIEDATLTDILNQNLPRDQRVTIYSRSRLKGSLKMVPVLDRLLATYRNQFDIPPDGLTYFPKGKGSLALDYHITPEDIQPIWAATGQLPINQQRSAVLSAVVDQIIKQHQQQFPARVQELIHLLETRSGDRQQMQKWAELIEPYDDRRIPTQEQVQKHKISEQNISSIINLVERNRRRALENFRGEVVHLVTEDFNHRWPSTHATEAWARLITDAKLLQKLSTGIVPWNEAQALLHKGAPKDYRFRVEDMAALAYLHIGLDGISHAQTMYDYLVVDEAQDLSPLQFWLLRKYSASGAMTILGDLAQSIHSYRGISRWQELIDVFPGDAIQYEEITQTYRSTYEITSFANQILQGPVLKDKQYRLAEPFHRHGPAVTCSQAENPSTLFQMIFDQLRHYHDQGYENIAVICKSSTECELVRRGLRALSLNVPVVLDSNQKYQTGMVILPAHVTKGLEFEACILANANSENYTATELDGRILYVSITRALHELAIFWVGQPSPHLTVEEYGGERSL